MIQHSVLIPIRDAAGPLESMLKEIPAHLAALGAPFEIILADDGRARDTDRKLTALMSSYPGLRVLRLTRQAGMSALLTSAVAAARGEIVIAVEGTGRYDASDIPRLVSRLNRLDAVFGCRRSGAGLKHWRNAMLIPRWLLLGKDVRDPDCLLWAARREAVAGLVLSRGMHRFLPTLIERRGFRIGDLHVESHRGGRPLRDVWPNPGDLLAVAWLVRRTPTFEAHELFPAPEAATGRVVRIDPAQPLDRRKASPSDAPRSDRKNDDMLGGVS